MTWQLNEPLAYLSLLPEIPKAIIAHFTTTRNSCACPRAFTTSLHKNASGRTDMTWTAMKSLLSTSTLRRIHVHINPLTVNKQNYVFSLCSELQQKNGIRATVLAGYGLFISPPISRSFLRTLSPSKSIAAPRNDTLVFWFVSKYSFQGGICSRSEYRLFGPNMTHKSCYRLFYHFFTGFNFQIMIQGHSPIGRPKKWINSHRCRESLS